MFVLSSATISEFHGVFVLSKCLWRHFNVPTLAGVITPSYRIWPSRFDLYTSARKCFKQLTPSRSWLGQAATAAGGALQNRKPQGVICRAWPSKGGIGGSLCLNCVDPPLHLCVWQTRIYVTRVVLNTGTDNSAYCLSLTGHAGSWFLVDLAGTFGSKCSFRQYFQFNCTDAHEILVDSSNYALLTCRGLMFSGHTLWNDLVHHKPLISGSNLNGTYVLQHRQKIHTYTRTHPHYIVTTHSKRVPNQTCHTGFKG